jgi:hypothetical protein
MSDPQLTVKVWREGSEIHLSADKPSVVVSVSEKRQPQTFAALSDWLSEQRKIDAVVDELGKRERA